MIGLFLVGLLSTSAFAASNPELSAKNAKTQLTSSPNQKSVSQHDEALLNSINAYAQQYENSPNPSKSYGISTQLFSQPYAIQQQPQPQPQQQYQQYQPQTSYRPQPSSPHYTSAPALETNFQPMPPAPQHHQPHIQAQHSPQAPVVMQYLPQTQQLNGGVQYLQLIPTRPLIVPINPYMSPMAQQTYHAAPQIIAPPHQLNEYVAARSHIAPNEPDAASNIPYGLQAYANSLQNYRSYRFNRDIKPFGMILNMQEYMPAPNDAPKLHPIRGRP